MFSNDAGFGPREMEKLWYEWSVLKRQLQVLLILLFIDRTINFDIFLSSLAKRHWKNIIEMLLSLARHWVRLDFGYPPCINHGTSTCILSLLSR
jgi:hypothetical protein